MSKFKTQSKAKVKLSSRALAAQALAQVVAHGQSLTQALPPCLDQAKEEDRGLIQELCFGTCRYWQRYEAMLEAFLQKPLKTKDSDVKALLAIGCYQLMELQTPDHAAINSCVNAVDELGKSWAKSMVNAVLRKIQRIRDGEEAEPDQWQRDSRVLYSHPKWLYLKLKQAWPNHWQAIVDANNTQPPMTLRVNALKHSRDLYQQQLHDLDIASELCPHANQGLVLQQAQTVNALPGFAEGACSVQDEAAQLAVTLLDLQAQQRVLDACCAPGGKTCHILEQQQQLEQLTALDIEQSRLSRVEDNLARLGLQAKVVCNDAADLEAWWDGQAFDRILLDAPCSATGVIRRHPDIKLLRRESDIAKLAALQLDILMSLWPSLKPGGRLVYATCSSLPEENEASVAAFLEQVDNAEHLALDVDWGIERPLGRQLFPQSGGHDGFYYAVLIKTK